MSRGRSSVRCAVLHPGRDDVCFRPRRSVAAAGGFAAGLVVLAKPPVSVSTAWAYQSYDAAPSETHPINQAMLGVAIEAGRLDYVARQLGNVLEAVTVKKYGNRPPSGNGWKAALWRR